MRSALYRCATTAARQRVPQVVHVVQLQHRLHPLGLVGGRETSESRNDRPLDERGAELGPLEIGVVAKVHVGLGLVADVAEAQLLVAVLKHEISHKCRNLYLEIT